MYPVYLFMYTSYLVKMCTLIVPKELLSPLYYWLLTLNKSLKIWYIRFIDECLHFKVKYDTREETIKGRKNTPEEKKMVSKIPRSIVTVDHYHWLNKSKLLPHEWWYKIGTVTWYKDHLACLVMCRRALNSACFPDNGTIDLCQNSLYIFKTFLILQNCIEWHVQFYSINLGLVIHT